MYILVNYIHVFQRSGLYVTEGSIMPTQTPICMLKGNEDVMYDRYVHVYTFDIYMYMYMYTLLNL